jgi:hypothetical protein
MVSRSGRLRIHGCPTARVPAASCFAEVFRGGADARDTKQGCMVAMTTTAVAAKNVITLRGSTEIVTEFFGAASDGAPLAVGPSISGAAVEMVKAMLTRVHVD